MEDLPNQTGPMVSWYEVKTIPGALELLRALAQQGKCYIATNANESSALQIRQALQRVGLDIFISDIFCFQEIGFKKPSIEYFTEVVTRINAPKSTLLMIGDSLQNDVEGALNAGIDAIWFNRYGDLCPAGIIAVSTLQEVLPLLTAVKD